MPFVSEKQRAYLYAKEPEVAREFQYHTPDKPLPECAPKKKKRMGRDITGYGR